MTRIKHAATATARAVGDVALTLAAAAGVVCLLLLLAGVAFDVRPLIFRSGSMSPSIPTGSLAISREVDHREIAVGDVVSVPYGEHRVTHRVVSIDHASANSLLRLKGDANDTADLKPYQVAAADRVILSVPYVGRAVAWLSRAPGIFVLAGYAAVLLTVLVRRRPPARSEPDPPAPTPEPDPEPPAPTPVVDPAEPGRHGVGRTGLVVVVAVVALGLTVPPTWAAWSDAVEVSGATLSATSLLSPTASASSGGGNGNATGNCQAVDGVLTPSTIALRWQGVAPSAPPPLSGYRYELQFWNRGTNQAQGNPVTVSHSGAAGSQQSYQQSSTTLGNLLGLNLFSNTRLQLRVRSRLVDTNWYGPARVDIDFSSSAQLAIASFDCNTA